MPLSCVICFLFLTICFAYYNKLKKQYINYVQFEGREGMSDEGSLNEYNTHLKV
jgi:hypothetical protein